MSGSGRGGNNRGNRRKPHRRREWEDTQPPRNAPGKKTADLFAVCEGRLERTRGGLYDRPKWSPPKPPALSLPAATCAWCEKPIKDIMTAICEPDSGKPVHFDCVINRITEREILDAGDTVGYIGGGRFGIIHYNNPPDTRDFKIRKVFEWEKKENHCEWRITISEHFSAT